MTFQAKIGCLLPKLYTKFAIGPRNGHKGKNTANWCVILTEITILFHFRVFYDILLYF